MVTVTVIVVFDTETEATAALAAARQYRNVEAEVRYQESWPDSNDEEPGEYWAIAHAGLSYDDETWLQTFLIGWIRGRAATIEGAT
jgi:hypothetical protein